MAKLVSKRYLGILPVFNMTVTGNHNYVTAGGTVLHNCDGIRYFCISRSLPGEPEKEAPEEEETLNDYDETMTGGKASANYLRY